MENTLAMMAQSGIDVNAIIARATIKQTKLQTKYIIINDTITDNI